MIPKRIKHLKKVEPGPGDRSWTWRWPFTDRTDDFARWLPTLWASRTVIVSRLGLDGTWARAMLGSLGYVLWIVAFGLAVVSLGQADGQVVAPPITILLVLTAIGVLDASAGALAWIVLVLGSMLTLNIGSLDDVRTLLGLGSLFIWPALLINAMRPLRRPGWQLTRDGRLERFFDYVIPPVIAAFLAGGVAKALNGLSGLELITSDDITAVRWVVGIAVVARYVLEDISAIYYPLRTQELAPADVSWPVRNWSLGGVLVSFVIFLVVAQPFFGLTPVTVLAALLTAVPGVLGLWGDSMPKSSALGKWLPKGMLKVLLMIIVSAYMAKVFIGDGGDDAVRSAMILMMIPGLIFSLVALFGGAGHKWPDTVLKRLGGVVTWVILLGITTGLMAL